MAAPSYSSDAPLASRDGDLFDRWPFAKRVAHVLRDRRDASSLVVGLYGTWGEGKTTVLNFIEEALADADDMAVVRFNPWRFGDEDALIRRFFDSLAEGVDQKLKTKGDVARAAASKVLSVLSASLSGAIPGLSAAAETLDVDLSKLVPNVSEVSLAALRDRLSEILREAKVRVVVRIDDIDRLDKDEVQAVFRLVKLSADFENVAYVLALDPDVVAAALQERYGPGQPRAGYDFLEKIVTVPLQIPPARPDVLFEMCAEAVEETLSIAGLELGRDRDRFVEAFRSGLLPAVETPRMAIRYGNAVRFALPILIGEVNPADQLLIEGMRVVYPDLYKYVRAHPEVLLFQEPGFLSGFGDSDDVIEASERDVELAVREHAPSHQASAHRLIASLFPTPASDREYEISSMRSDRRIGSEWYFERYFTYAVSGDAVSDAALAEIVSVAEAGDADRCTAMLTELLNEKSKKRVAGLLGLRLPTVSPRAFPALAVSLARRLNDFSDRPELLDFSLRRKVAVAMSQMVSEVQPEPDRLALAKRVLTEIPSLYGAWEFWDDLLPLFEPNDAEELTATFTERLTARALADPLHLSEASGASRLYGTWAKLTSRDEVLDHLRLRLKQHPDEAVLLLRKQALSGWPSGADEPRIVEFNRETYEFVRTYMDPDDIAEALAGVYDASALDLGYVNLGHIRVGAAGTEGVSIDEGLARQFMFVHRRALAEAEAEETVGDAPETD